MAVVLCEPPIPTEQGFLLLVTAITANTYRLRNAAVFLLLS